MKYFLLLCALFHFELARALEATPLKNAATQALENYAFDPGAKFQTDGLLVLKGEKIIFEKYAHGFSATKPHLLWSVSKSFASALIGIATKKGILSLDTYAYTLEPRLNRPEADSIKIKDLLQMSSGIDWSEGYEANPLKSNVIAMLYLDGQKNMARYTANQDMKKKAGKRFNYSSGETNLLCHMLRKALGDTQLYHDFPWDELFTPLGITSATWERDGVGNFVCSSYLYMTPRDAARFGLLYARDGVWQGEAILPKGWVKASGEIAPAFLKTKLLGSAKRESYGYSWWLNWDLPAKDLKRPYPSAPENTMIASGHHGQMIAVFPDLDAVVVRTGEDKDKRIDTDTLLKLALEVLKQESK